MSGNKESVRRGPWMKMLLNAAQTLPLFVGKVGEKPPPLCGAIPADSSYTAKVKIYILIINSLKTIAYMKRSHLNLEYCLLLLSYSKVSVAPSVKIYYLSIEEAPNFN